MTDFTGKLGLVVGVANKRSLSWAIAQATAARGARLALTYQGRFEEHVNDLSQGLTQPPLVLPCDVSSDQDIDAVFAKVEQEFGGLDFVVHGAAFAPREELSAPFSRAMLAIARRWEVISIKFAAIGPVMPRKPSRASIPVSLHSSLWVAPGMLIQILAIL